MKKKTTVKYSLMLLGLVIFLGVYFLFYLDYTDRTDKLNGDIAQLSDRFDELESYKAHTEEYEAGIEGDKTKISQALKSYYSAQLPEDFIMLATALEDDVDISISSLSFEEPFYIADINAIEDMTDYQAPVQTRQLTAYGLTATLEGAMTYGELKQALDYIGRQEDVTSLNSIELSYDNTTGLILGSMVVNKYFITGRDIEEHQPYVPYTDIGNDAPMGG